jgi:hypothetical protein
MGSLPHAALAQSAALPESRLGTRPNASTASHQNGSHVESIGAHAPGDVAITLARGAHASLAACIACAGAVDKLWTIGRGRAGDEGERATGMSLMNLIRHFWGAQAVMLL